MRNFTPVCHALYLTSWQRRSLGMSILLCTILMPGKLFAQTPIINSFSPVNGPVGTTVTITGSGFNALADRNIVFFGATQATVTSATTATLKVKVPVGATYAPITVLNKPKGLIAYSRNSFIPVFSPVKPTIAIADFTPALSVSTDEYPGCVAIGDLDGDGKPDVVTSNNGAHTVSIYRNTSTPGNVSFAAKVDIAIPGAGWAAIGDIDGDGRLDIAVLSGNNVSVLLNTSTPGNVSFAARVDLAAGNTPTGIAIGDLDGDGRPDLVTSNYDDNTVSVLRNTGSPGRVHFAIKRTFAVNTQPEFVAITDLDGDGKPDLAVDDRISPTGPTSPVSILHNTSTPGNITFSSLPDLGTGYGPTCISTGDFDGDGKPDLLVTNSLTYNYTVFQNASSPGNINLVTLPYINSGGQHFTAAIADLNGDGKPDFASPNLQPNTIALEQNTSTIGNISFAPDIEMSVNQLPYAIAIGDIDGDGKPDLVETSDTYSTLNVYRNNPIFPPQLSALVTSNGTLSPAFNTDSLKFTVTVKNSTRSITVTPTLLDAHASVKVDNIAVTSGTASPPISLKPGDNPIPVIVTAQDGKTQTYSIMVTRTPSPSGTLSALILSSGTLLPAFNANKTTYVDTVANDVSTLQITPTAISPDAVVKVNDEAVAPGSSATIALLKVGIPNEVHIIVRSHDGIITDYVLMVTRLSANAKLSGLSFSVFGFGGTLTPLTPTFSPERNVYRDTLNATDNNGYPDISVTLTTENSHAKIMVDGRSVISGVPEGLTLAEMSVGVDTMKIGVTAHDGSTREYRVIRVRPFLSRDATLSNLTISSGTLRPAFASNVYAYADTVDTDSIQVTPTANNKYARIYLKSQLIPSGVPSPKIAVNATGFTAVNIGVVSSIGNTQNYKITLHRLAKSTNSLVFSVPSINQFSVNVYPNPATSTFNIHLLNGDPNNKAIIKVMNLQGQVIYQTKGNVNDTFTFGQDLPGGIYIVIVTNGSLNKQMKLIKAMN